MTSRALVILVAVALASCLEGDGSGRPAGELCSEDSDCEDRARCLFGRCRAECAADRDCPQGTSCGALGAGVTACSLPEGTSALVEGDPCVEDCECPTGQLCGAGIEGWVPVCTGACGVDCDGTPETGMCVSGPDTGTFAFFCTVPCDPVAGEECPMGVHCAIIDDWSGAEPFTHCAYVTGTGLPGDPCRGPEDCALGHQCVRGGTCARSCAASDSEGCPEGTGCTADLVPLGGESYGACQ